jgi:CGNR zinc finger
VPELTDIVAGKWVRFDRYEVRDGYVRPAPGAQLEVYDPWAEYSAAIRPKGRQERPYTDLLNAPFSDPLLDDRSDALEAPKRLRGERERTLPNWCAKHGLLGILLQRANAVVLPARWEWHPLAQGRDEKWAIPVQRSFVRSATRWEDGFERIEDKLEKFGRHEAGDPVVEEELLRHFEQAHTVLPPMQRRPFDEWAKFFPDVNWQYPMPGTEAFWRSYAEPVDECLAAIAMFQWAVWHVQRLSGRDVPDLLLPTPYDLQGINGLIAPASAVWVVTDGGRLQQRWAAPSLLASFAMMVVRDMSHQLRFSCCANPTCGNWFITAPPRTTRYCSSRCTNTMQVRRYRERETTKLGTKKGPRGRRLGTTRTK